MKKLLSLLSVCILVTIMCLPATPIGAKNVFYFYESLLEDSPTSDILHYGKVTINNKFVAEIEVQTDQPGKTYNVRMEHGVAGPFGVNLRRNVYLGTMTMDDRGKGKAEFTLESPPIRIAGPHFVVYSSSPMPDFDTSYGPVPPIPPTAALSGRIVLNMQTLPGSNQSFNFDLSYGNYCGYPAGLSMPDNFTVDSGNNLPPGVYTINETLPPGWISPDISIDDPSGGTTSAGTLTTVNLAAGECVTITYINT